MRNAESHTGRARLIARIHDHLERRGRPRLELFVIVSLAGLVGFLASVLLLAAGVRSMPVRYGCAGAAGYLAFFCLLAAYIRWKRGYSEIDPTDALDVLQYADPVMPRPDHVTSFAGGRSGGAGASGSWESRSPAGSGEGGSWFDADADLGWVLLVVAAALAAAGAVGYVIWAAPALLAELLVDAVIVSTVSQHVGLVERRDWTATALRRTWMPAVLMIVTLVVCGWALQTLAPGAASIGPALRSLEFR